MRLAFLRKSFLKFFFCVTLATAASTSFADTSPPSFCDTPGARMARESNIGIAADIEYGNSQNELMLYRLMRGIDSSPLPPDLRDLPWYIGHEPPADWPNAGDPDTSRFQQLLVPATVLQANKDERTKFQYAQLFLQIEGLRSYRPEAYTGFERRDDWWLDEPASSPYRALDVADWLQTMAASDNLHRISRYYGKRAYRPLIASWTYFATNAFHNQAYDRITQHALERWRTGNDMVWQLALFSRVLPTDELAATLVERFLALHAKVKACNATQNEYLSYPLLRFHTLRLLFSKGLEDDGARNPALRLMADGPVIQGSPDYSTVTDAAIARRVALLYTS